MSGRARQGTIETGNPLVDLVNSYIDRRVPPERTPTRTGVRRDSNYEARSMPAETLDGPFFAKVDADGRRATRQAPAGSLFGSLGALISCVGSAKQVIDAELDDDFFFRQGRRVRQAASVLRGDTACGRPLYRADGDGRRPLTSLPAFGNTARSAWRPSGAPPPEVEAPDEADYARVGRYNAVYARSESEGSVYDSAGACGVTCADRKQERASATPPQLRHLLHRFGNASLYEFEQRDRALSRHDRKARRASLDLVGTVEEERIRAPAPPPVRRYRASVPAAGPRASVAYPGQGIPLAYGPKGAFHGPPLGHTVPMGHPRPMRYSTASARASAYVPNARELVPIRGHEHGSAYVASPGKQALQADGALKTVDPSTFMQTGTSRRTYSTGGAPVWA